MKKNDFGKSFGIQVIVSLFAIIFPVIINYLYSNLTQKDILIMFSESSEAGEDYFTTINLICNDNHQAFYVNFLFDQEIEIISDVASFNRVEAQSYTLNNLMPNKTYSFLIKTKNPVVLDNTYVSGKGKMQLFANPQINDNILAILLFLYYSVALILMLIGSMILNKRIRKIVNENNDENNKKILKIKTILSKENKINIRRIRDLTIELNFWKNVIRNVITKDEKELFCNVTSELKTFTTQEKFVNNLKDVYEVMNEID